TEKLLPAVVCERFVRFRHLVRVFALLDRVAAVVRRVHDLACELVDHRLLAAAVRVADQPADGESGAARRANFDRNLIVRSTDAAALDLERRLDVVDGLLEQLEGVVLGAVFDLAKSTIELALSHRLPSLAHERVDELGDELAVVDRIRQDLALRNFTSSRHWLTYPKLLNLRLRHRYLN